MSKRVIVKNIEGDEKFTLSFALTLPEYRIDKQFNLNRDLGEETQAFLERLTNNVNKAKPGGKKKKALQSAEDDKAIKVNFSHSETTVIPSLYKTINDFLFLDNLHLNVDDHVYKVVINPPLVKELRMSPVIMTDLLIYPHILKVEFAEPEKTKIEWFVSQRLEESSFEHSNKKLKQEFEDSLTWTSVGTGFHYKPSVSNINCRLKCEVTPASKAGDPGETTSLLSSSLVTASPGPCPFHSRHQWTRCHTPITSRLVRTVSYNILADLYADSDFSRTVLFAQCPAYALNIDYRVKLVLDEILGYNADLVCLQEVDRKIFDLHLSPIFGLFGLEGNFAKKGGQVDEGLGIFFRTERFQLVLFTSVFVPAALQTEAYSHIWDRVKDNEKLVESLINRTTTLAVSVLEETSTGDLLVVGNTHLYFSPNADHIRLIQVEVCRAELDRVRGEVQAANLEKKVVVMLCGDFNSTPPFGVLEYMTSGLISEAHPDWASQEGEEVVGLRLAHQNKFVSAAGTPQFTNFTQGFKDCLDYIFIEEDKMNVKQVVPFPSEEELLMNIALPNTVFPSDHVAVVVDLEFIPET